MKNGKKALILRICCVVLTLVTFGSILFHVSGNTRYFEGDAEVYYNELIDKGFPEDYAASLTELHLLHPNWNFTPLNIKETNSKYTWDYVISKETEDPETNLISSSSSQIPYRHPTNLTIYDSGYYQASVAAVEYFMDPRNFLNETDIFQFYDLSVATNASLEAVEAILAGTFMENARLENGMTYAEYFLSLGNEISIDPIYLAVKVRQEQGVNGTSPLISGTCGDKLWELYQNGEASSDYTNETPQADLLSYNGLYNFLNMGAYGNGHFKIYLKGMQRAKTGTGAMASIWGSPEWNTRWKSIYGGAYNIKNSYIDRYQSTIYLQKFNVDGRASDNFTWQYMQNVGGSLTESRTLYSSFASLDALDTSCNFLIPVYDKMPANPCADPAGGNCSYLASAKHKFDYSLTFSAPLERSASNAPLYLSQEIPTAKPFHISGKVEHSYGVLYLEYQWDGGEWVKFEQTEGFSISLPIDFSEGSSHILVIRGRAAYDHEVSTKKSNSYFLAAVMYIKIQPPPIAYVTLNHQGTKTDLEFPMGSTYTLPLYESPYFVGWMQDGTLLPGGKEIVLKDDLVLTAAYLDFMQLEGAALIFDGDALKMRYTAAIDDTVMKALQSLGRSVRFYAEIREENLESKQIPVTLGTVANAYGKDWQLIKADSMAIPDANWNTAYTMAFFAVYTNDNGEEVTLPVTNTPSATRTPSQIAQMALLDPGIIYGTTYSERLRMIAAAAY